MLRGSLIKMGKTSHGLLWIAALAVFPASWWIARNGPGNFPLAAVLGACFLALGLAIWFLPRGQMRVWAIGVLSMASVIEGLSSLGVLPLPSQLGIYLMLAAIILVLATRRSPKAGR
jgi:hypothetical protein